MITGFNTDVHYRGRVYHVQTEDRGLENPVLESLVYLGGTIIAKKQTSYAEHLKRGASSEVIASLLRRQHQIIIAAIKAGKIEELINSPEELDLSDLARPEGAVLAGDPTPTLESKPASASLSGRASRPSSELSKTGGLDLDRVIADYLKRSSEQGKLDLKVISPSSFVAGKNVALRVLVSRGAVPEAEAVVTVKVIGTTFKPQVYMARADYNGIAKFNFALPAFNAGTAAIVIEAQSNRGRGELKHLIRRA
jgi:hypothetical protein